MTEMKWTGLKFEPHGLYGQKIDGEAMPFGYISEQGYGKPVFELSPIFVHPTEDLRALALQMAAAPEMAEALRALDVHWTEDFPSGPDSQEASDKFTDETLHVWRSARAALLKAGG